MKKIFSIAVTIIIFDQIMKYVFCNAINMGESIIIIPNFFSFTLVKNTGVAFSLFSGSQIPIILLAIMIIIGLFKWIQKQELTIWKVIAFGILYGGIFGNLIDRIFRAGVIDYLDFTIFGYSFAIFNFADICVVCGAILMMAIFWKEDWQCKHMK